jgi:hypothetical protein
MKRNIYKLILSALFVSVGLTSCLKDDDIDNQKYGLINLNANKIIEIPSDASHQVSLTLLPEGVKDFTIGEIRLAAESPASEDVTVSLTSAKTAEIIGNKPMFPLDGVIVPATVTIPKGQRSVPLVVKINTALLQSAPQYLAISISSVDKQGYIVSGNFGHVKLNMKIKHKYQGIYVLTGTLVDNLSTTLKHVTYGWGDEPYTVHLETKDGQTLMLYDELVQEDYVYPLATTAGSFSGYGTFCPEFTFDAEGNITAVTNHHGVPANTRTAQLDPSGVNKYDPATKSFTVSYWMNQPSLVPTPPHHRTSITETYTFKEDL